MIRALLSSIGKNPSTLHGKHLYYPKYGTSHYEPQEYRPVLTPYKMNFDIENEKWTEDEKFDLDQPEARGGSECNTNNPAIKPVES